MHAASHKITTSRVNVKHAKSKKFVFIKSEYKIIKVRFEDILFCEGMKDYTQVYIKGKSDPLLTLNNLKSFSAKLPADEFMRVHRSYIVSISHIDSIVRNAKDLQLCAAADSACIRIHPTTADRLQLDEIATVSQGDIEITLPLKRDERIAADVVWVANAMPETVDLGHSFAAITIKP